ncbi:MAG: BMP family ABC transporter substrate-binding protein [Clostridiales bacterium]|nr:BMP family ABC transporter substrate-binding protein [Clostridiales bacterium]
MKKWLAIALCAMMMLCLVACGGGESAPQGGNEGELTLENVKIGLIYIGDPSDNGYNYAHDKGRKFMAEELGLKEEQMIVKANVSEDSACADAINELIEAGCNIIFGNSFGFMDFMAEAAEEHPEIYFCHATGIKSNDTNFCNYFGRVYQPRYLAGIAAGMRTETNKLGYVAAFSNSECNSGINAFTLGAQSVNPDIEVIVKYTNSWYDPTGERQAAEALLDAGCDVIAQHVDTTGPQVAAQERGAWGCGYNNDMTEFAPDAHLCAPVWNWGAIMKQLVEDVIAGEFTGGIHLGSMAIGTCYLSPLTDNVAEGTEEKIKAAYDKIVDENDEFDVFNGPIYDNEGNLQIAEGEKASDELIAQNMTWLVKGVRVD